MKKILILLILFTSFLSYSVTLTIRVSVRSKKDGILFLELVDEKSFSDTSVKSGLPSYEKRIKKNKGTRTYTVIFRDINPGEYAVRGFLDENENHKVDYFGILPKEAWGTSGKRPIARAPKWKDAVFEIGDEDRKIEVIMK